MIKDMNMPVMAKYLFSLDQLTANLVPNVFTVLNYPVFLHAASVAGLVHVVACIYQTPQTPAPTRQWWWALQPM